MTSADKKGMVWSEEILDKYPVLRKWNDSDGAEWRGGREQALLKYIKARPDFKDIQGVPAKVLGAIDDFAYNERFLINVGSDKGAKLAMLIAEEKPKVLVELGGYIGYSAILFADAMRRNTGKDDEVHLFSLEFDEEFASIAKELVDIAGLSSMVTVVVGPAAESLRNLEASGYLQRIDFLFIDHVEDLYVADLKVAEELKLLKPGAMVVADNVVRPGAPKYREYVRSHAGLTSYGLPGLILPGELTDELEISKVL